MSHLPGQVVILVADDDADDRAMTSDAVAESRLPNPVRFVEDGEVLMDYLHQEGRFSGAAGAPRPGIILLDLNMPRKDGREALAEIKADPELRHIPVVVLTTSRAKEDVFSSYDLGASSFISKPVTFDGLVDLVRTIGKYWLETVDLPRGEAS